MYILNWHFKKANLTDEPLACNTAITQIKRRLSPESNIAASVFVIHHAEDNFLIINIYEMLRRNRAKLYCNLASCADLLFDAINNCTILRLVEKILHF